MPDAPGPPVGRPAASAAPTVRVATLADYARISELESRFLPEVVPEAQWRRFFVDNPLWARVGATWPVGWLLVGADDAVVGSLYNIPSLYRWRGRELLCANGRGWVVDPRYRGYALWLMDEYYNQEQADLFVNTTVAEDVMSVQEQYAHRVPRGDWEQLAFRPTHYRAFAAKLLEIKHVPLRPVLAPVCGAGLYLADALRARIPAGPGWVEVAEPQCFDERFDALWAEIVAANPDVLLAQRDRATLSWHHAVPASRGHLRIFTASRGDRLRAYCVLQRHPRELGIRSMRLVDFQTAEPDEDLLSPLLRAATRRCATEGQHVVEHLGCGLPKTAGFDRVAPYRLRHNWSFYYQTSDPELATELRRPETWDPSDYDGDASLA